MSLMNPGSWIPESGTQNERSPPREQQAGLSWATCCLAAASARAAPHLSKRHRGDGDSWLHPDMLRLRLRWAAERAVLRGRAVSARAASGLWGEAAHAAVWQEGRGDPRTRDATCPTQQERRRCGE